MKSGRDQHRGPALVTRISLRQRRRLHSMSAEAKKKIVYVPRLITTRMTDLSPGCSQDFSVGAQKTAA